MQLGVPWILDVDVQKFFDTFDFLGFTHYWAKSRRGYWVVKRRTAASRMTRSLRAISQWYQTNRHRPIAWQHRALCQKFRGHFSYYGITGNSEQLSAFRREAVRYWYQWLRRRYNQRPHWSWFKRLLKRYPLPSEIAVHSKYRVAKT